MNYLKIFDETFSDKKKFVFIVFYDLLNSVEFENLLPKEYNDLLSQFNQEIEFSSFERLDFNRVLNKNNKSTFIQIFESIISNKRNAIPLNENVVLKSKIFFKKDFKKIGKIIYKQIDNRINETELYKIILNALKFESFFKTSKIVPEEILCTWISIKETRQLRINYNMTDFFPIGTQIELNVECFDSEYYKFICLTKVMDYNSRETYLFKVHETNIQIKDGFFYHYNIETNNFIYKKPIYEFENDKFKTLIDDYEFTFQRKTTANKQFGKSEALVLI